MGERVRKVRKDKKHDIKPTINLSLYEIINKISYITNTPMKDVGETIITTGLYDRKVIDVLSKKFKRDYWKEGTLYKGDPELINDKTIKITGLKKRFTMRFPKEIYEDLNRLAFALDMTVSSTTNLLLQLSIKNTEILNMYIHAFILSELDSNRVRELERVIRFINKHNPYNEEITISAVLFYLKDEFKETSTIIKEKINSWIELYKV